MPKEVSDHLFRLIGRMSKSEKRFFKLMAARQKGGGEKFVVLFDRLEKMKTYDEELLLKREPSLSRKQLPNLKSFLYSYLLRSLRLCNSSGSADVRLSDYCCEARILYDKCLYRDSLRMIERARKFAHTHGRTGPLMDLLDLEKEVIRHTITADHAQKVDESVSDTGEVLEQLNRTTQFSNLLIRLNAFYVQSGFIRNRKDLYSVQRFFRKNLPAYEESRLGFPEKLYLYSAFTGYYFFIQDFRNGYRYSKRSVDLFEKFPGQIYNYPEFYIRALNSQLVVLNKFRRLEEFEAVHRQLIALKRNGAFDKTENINLNLFRAIYVHEINRHFMMGEFRSGVRVVAKLEKELNRFIPLLDHHSLLLFYYKIACLYFGADQYRSALHWLSRIIGEKDISVREDLHAFARILALICHFELGNDRLAEAHVKSLYRYLLRKGDLSAYHREILAFIRKLHRNLSPRELNLLFHRLKDKMSSLSRQRFERRAFFYFDIITWLESKISNRTVEQIIKEKVKAADRKLLAKK
ncbi:MAG TPA: hypothetical protein VFU15_11105 [Bacteroidia bacterium]|nr:hypothetical protein [Bacteroidia bacterium]